jgi:hypothetical protein
MPTTRATSCATAVATLLTGRGDINTYAVFSGLSRDLLSSWGRAGIVVPTGIATDSTTQLFFGDLIAKRSLAKLIGFENEAFIFPDVHHSFKFCALVITGDHVIIEFTDFVFLCRYFEQVQEKERHFELSYEDFLLLNPNTQTCPIFRTKADAQLTKKIYRHGRVLINEESSENPWGVRFFTMFHMANDSHYFENSSGENLRPLYEAKMMHQFDHRYATYENATQANLNAGILPQTTEFDKKDPYFTVLPRYWVTVDEIETRLRDWPYKWLIGFRDVTSAVVYRTAIFSLLPRVGIGHKIPLVLFENDVNPTHIACFLGAVNSLVFDFVTRQKIGGMSLSYFILKQLPLPTPQQLTIDHLSFLVPRVLELVYTSWDIKSFADDVWASASESLQKILKQKWNAHPTTINEEIIKHKTKTPEGFPYPPFTWDENRRAILRAELDAYYAKLFGLEYDELRYVLDPVDAFGGQFPSETFRVLKEKEIKQYGEYRTRRLVLEAWERLGLG